VRSASPPAGRPAAEALLKALVPGPVPAADLYGAAGLPPEDAQEALDYLRTRDLVACDEAGRWELRVPLMWRWLYLQQGKGGTRE
jgi:DNA-binding IclR family transcriptional regulator